MKIRFFVAVCSLLFSLRAEAGNVEFLVNTEMRNTPVIVIEHTFAARATGRIIQDLNGSLVFVLRDANGMPVTAMSGADIGSGYWIFSLSIPGDLSCYFEATTPGRDWSIMQVRGRAIVRGIDLITWPVTLQMAVTDDRDADAVTLDFWSARAK